MQSRNHFWIRLVYLTITIAASAFAVSAQERTIKVAIPAVNMSVISFSTALEKGFYRDEGMRVELILMPAPVATRALIAGETHFAAVGGATMPAVVQGAPLRFLFSTFNRPLYWLYSRSDIREVKELKDKKISVSGIGSGPDSLLRDLLKKNALEPGRDVAILGMGSNPTLLASLQSGSVDASMLSPPFTFLADDTGFRELVSFVKQDRVEVQGSVVVREALLKSDYPAVEKFLRATLRGFHFARTNRAATIPVLARIQNIAENLATKTYDVARTAMTLDGTLNEEMQRKAMETVLDRLGIKDYPPDRVFNYSISHKINTELSRKGISGR
ncbi:MAG TPA: ABC transporter substrate-binding protein [Candidatus Binatia bacterium]|jgi:ABC-type nitrate/sulfonate/bicarbonate transport system substrate-binding protein|nr:ABC transporter substrate-binding protein [Candidatus Binatia bacterium]